MSARFVLLGGFLGAGKTTAIARLARHYMQRGLKVGIVTNDQAADLVDTQSLRSQGFDVDEVTGACFCCNFNELTSTVERLAEAHRPDILLAEPVGSCTDLVATVIRPLAQIYARPLEIAPYGVLFKPSHGDRILRGEPAGFSPKAAYIFRKQLEEADVLVMNRIDELIPSEIERISGLLDEAFPGRPQLRISARTGAGFPALCEFLDQSGSFGRRVIELDYDIYAEGEAELGWLNSQMRVVGEVPWSLDALLMQLIDRLRQRLASEQAETAHLKLIGLADATYAVANLISGFTAPELSLPSRAEVREADVVVNARVATDPGVLEAVVRAECESLCREWGLNLQVRTLQSFRPGRPRPTHRIASAGLAAGTE